MQYLLNAREMKQADKNTIETFGVPSLVLMERAALKVIETIQKENLDFSKTLIVCGTGNNGGDGMAVARILHLSGADVRVWLTGTYEKCSDETKKQYDILKAYGMEVIEEVSEEEMTDTAYTLVIDAIFGIGLSRNIEGKYREIIEFLNEIKADKVSVDIPSGIHADSGIVMGCCFYADHTVTFAYNKLGLCLYPGAEAAGRVHVAEIGITKESFLEKEPQTLALEERDSSMLPTRRSDSNKGSYGKVLVIAGSEEMAGAAYFSAKAAYLAGCGLVKIFTHEKNKTMLNEKLPEAILVTYDGKKNRKEVLIESVNWADVIVLGPGLGTSETAESILQTTLQTASVPMVLDADALNLLAKETELLKRPHTDLILTPHLGEMSRLIDMPIAYIKKNLLETAQEFAREYNVICVQKDVRTVTSIPYGKTYVNLSGNHGMATAGSGDVLSGMIAGLLAGGMSPEYAAALGVWLHGRAGDIMAERTGYYSLMAGDILEGIKEVTK
ncbi:MAG: NAD(P)H-hydrate dehydratase [Lachnospiraceae bacterium]